MFSLSFHKDDGVRGLFQQVFQCSDGKHWGQAHDTEQQMLLVPQNHQPLRCKVQETGRQTHPIVTGIYSIASESN